MTAIGDPAGVLIAAETGFLKRGIRSAGVARQYSGPRAGWRTARLGCSWRMRCPAPAGVLIDRELYLPQSWTDDRDRRAQAGIGEDVAFATKPELARQMIERAIVPG